MCCYAVKQSLNKSSSMFSYVTGSTEILLDMVCKLQKPNVALCHQMPFTTDQKGFAQSLEKVC